MLGYFYILKNHIRRLHKYLITISDLIRLHVSKLNLILILNMNMILYIGARNSVMLSRKQNKF